MPVLEKHIEDAVIKKVERELGVMSVKFLPPGSDGWPDRLFWLPGRPLFIEFKLPGEEPRPLQLFRHKFLRDLGYEVQVHDDVNTAFQAIAQALAARRRPKARR